MSVFLVNTGTNRHDYKKDSRTYKIIYDDIIYSLQKSGGISCYWSKLEEYLTPDERLLYSGCEENIFFNSFESEAKIRNHKLFERYKNIAIQEIKPFIFHSSYYRYCKNKNAINITTVHDFMHEKFRHDIKAYLFSYQKKSAIKHSRGIIFNSNNTKNDFFTYYPQYKGLTKVIYNGGYVEEYQYLNLKKQKNIVFVSNRNGYKNFTYAVAVLQKLPEFILTIVGGGQLTKNEKCFLNTYIPNRYEYYPFLSNKDLNIKYNEAFFLLYPSLYEGLGLPVIEAQAAGCPVVCCNVSSLPEVGGDAAVYISGKNIEYDMSQISKLNNTAFYKKILERGLENCIRFSWKKCAEETSRFYEEVLNMHF